MNRIAQRLAFLAALILTLAIGSAAPFIPYARRNVVVGGGGLAPNVIFSLIEKELAYRTPTSADRIMATVALVILMSNLCVWRGFS